MTRINSAIPPAQLCDQHLVAEYRELPRVSTLSWKLVGKISNTGWDRIRTLTFCLGPGHVMFFLDKGAFLARRHARIVTEMSFRGFTVNFPVYPPHHKSLSNDYIPTKIERELLRDRICLRMPRSPRWTRRTPPQWISKTN